MSPALGEAAKFTCSAIQDFELSNTTPDNKDIIGDFLREGGMVETSRRAESLENINTWNNLKKCLTKFKHVNSVL